MRDEIGQRETFRVVLALRDLRRPAEPALLLGTEVPRDDARLASLGELWAGAGWHEREAADLFGVFFSGADADGRRPRRLLLDDAYAGSPLRKDDVLAARAGLPWPGSPGAGRACRRRERAGRPPDRARSSPRLRARRPRSCGVG